MPKKKEEHWGNIFFNKLTEDSSEGKQNRKVFGIYVLNSDMFLKVMISGLASLPIQGPGWSDIAHPLSTIKNFGKSELIGSCSILHCLFGLHS